MRVRPEPRGAGSDSDCLTVPRGLARPWVILDQTPPRGSLLSPRNGPASAFLPGPWWEQPRGEALVQTQISLEPWLGSREA